MGSASLNKGSAGGFVLLFRSLLDSDVFNDEWMLKLFVWCLLKAAYKKSNFKGQDLLAGQFVTGRISAADELMVSPSKVYRGLQALAEKHGCITLESNSKWTIVTVCNWQTYQLCDPVSRTAVEQPVIQPVIQPADSTWTAGDTTDEHNITKKQINNIISTCASAKPGDDLTFLRGPDPEFLRWWEILPAGMRSGQDACVAFWRQAIVAIQTKIPVDEAGAITHLIQRTQLFAKSPRGLSEEFRWSPLTFLKDGHYDDSVESWETTNGSRANRGRSPGTKPKNVRANDELNAVFDKVFGKS